FFQAEDGIRDFHVTGVQTCALPICGSDRAARFLGEVAALAKLSHPNIARIVDYGADPARGLCYLVQEYFEGATLRDDITAHPNRSEERRVGKECRSRW